MAKHDCLEPVSGKVKLAKIDTRETHGMTQEEAEARYLVLQSHLKKLQARFYAANSHALLLLLQGMDTSGKDGTIKKVVDAVDPQGVHLSSFKAPTAEELAHDFLWRIHQQVPARGQIGIFNRSHYEDVLIVRVRNFVPESVWRRRYEQINNFEENLADTGTIIIKVMLHVSKAEQKARLEARLADPEKNWKFNPADLKEREKWDDYQKAYEEALEECSHPHAPWYVIPADRKWYRNWAITQLLVNALEKLDPQFPVIDHGNVVIPD